MIVRYRLGRVKEMQRQDFIFAAIQAGSPGPLKQSFCELTPRALMRLFLNTNILGFSIRAPRVNRDEIAQIVVSEAVRAEKEYKRYLRATYPHMSLNDNHPILNKRHRLGLTALHEAAYYNNPAAAQALINAGANALIKDETQNKPYDVVINLWQEMMDKTHSTEQKRNVDNALKPILTVLREVEELQSGQRVPVRRHGFIARVIHLLTGGNDYSNAA